MKMQSLLASVLCGAIASVSPVMVQVAGADTGLFGAQDLDRDDVVAIAVPIDQGEAYNLLVLEQLRASRDCWREKTTGNVTVIEPLLLDFDFTNICGRSTDSNGYSLRLAGEEMAWRYSLRLVWEGEELVLKAFNTENSWRSPIEVGRTQGMADGMLKIEFNEGWRMSKRTYEGATLSHIYIENDQPVARLITAPVAEPAVLVASKPEILPKKSTGSGSGSIQIFVPPVREAVAVSSVTPLTVPTSPLTAPASPTIVASVDSLGVVPVPNKSIPTYESSSSGVIRLGEVSRLQPPPPPSTTSLAMSLGLKYRVVVDAATSSEKDTLKTIVPDAFHTWVGDRRMMQVGAYADETEAQAMQTRLSESGFAAQIVSVR